MIKHSFIDDKLKVTLDKDVTPEDFKAIEKLILSKSTIKYFGLDMHNCHYIHSKILAEVIALKKVAAAKKFELVLLNITESVYQLFEMANLLAFFKIDEDFSLYSFDEISELFLDSVYADKVSDNLATNYSEEIRNNLLTLVTCGDSIKKEYSILTMGKAQDFSGVELYRKELDSEYPNVQYAAILVLGWIGDVVSKNRLYDFIINNDEAISEAAVASIALLSDETDAAKLAVYLENKNPHVRKCAVQALSLINGEECYGYISKLLAKESDEGVKVVLAKRISSFNKDEVVAVLIKLLDDNSIAVREAAASSIVRVGVKSHMDSILAKVAHSDSWVGFFATRALAGVDDEAAVKHLMSVYDSVDQNVKLAIIEVVGKSKYCTEDFLVSKLKDSNEDIRKEALSVLGSLSLETATKKAVELMDTDESWLVRYKAVEIILEAKSKGYADLLRSKLPNEKNKHVKDKILSSVGEE